MKTLELKWMSAGVRPPVIAGSKCKGEHLLYLMYVDESGDVGMVNSPTRYFVLTGLVVHELRWKTYLDQLVEFRRRMRTQYGLRLREEIHAGAMITRPGQLNRIPRNQRLAILRHFADELASMADLNVINVVVDKGRPNRARDFDVFAAAWTALIQRFANTLSSRNFNGPQNPDERGILLPDNTDDKKLTRLLRQMRRYNPVPNQAHIGGGYRSILVDNIVEDPSFRNSADNLFIQAADLVAYLLYQHQVPSAYMKKSSAHNYFNRLSPILCKVAASRDSQGIVRL